MLLVNRGQLLFEVHGRPKPSEPPIRLSFHDLPTDM